MLKISILKVESPACLWGRVVGGPGGDSQITGQYNCLTKRMNMLYHDVTQDYEKLKFTPLEKGQICVVFSSALRSWCRAKIEAVITDSVCCQVRCFLVDNGQQIVVLSHQVRVALPDFLQLPFWVRRFHLSGIKPIGLLVSVDEGKAEMVPSSHWDSSSTLYLHKLLQASDQIKAVLCDTEEDSTSIQLYLMFGNLTVCANDELVAKKFAYYSNDPAAGGGLDDEDRKPVMLSSRILNHSVRNITPMPLSPPLSVPPPVSGRAAACEVLLNGSQSQILQDKFAISEELANPDVTVENKLPDIKQSTGSCSGASAAESDCTEVSDSSLTAALTHNISLSKCMKFLDPQCRFNQTASVLKQEDRPDDTENTTADTKDCSRPSEFDDSLLELEYQQLSNEPKRREAGSSSEFEVLEKRKSWRSEEHWTCSRLLEWLNPKTLNVPVDSEMEEATPAVDPAKDLLLVHTIFPLQPCQSWDDAPITDQLRREMPRKSLYTLSPADCYSWPALARGCNTLIVAPNAAQPISYLPPLLSHILQNSMFSPNSSAGPIGVVVCPGWEKAQVIFDLLEETAVSQSLHPLIIHMGVKKDEAKSVEIPKNCLFVVTTPFSFARILSHHCFLFLRMCHLVLDEADQLFTLAPEQMTAILLHFQKVVSREDRTVCPRQIVAVSKQWKSPMETLIASHMPHPSIIIAAPEEAALYANLQQNILMTLESSKINALLGTLDFTPDVGQKTLIITSCPQEAEKVFEAVSNKSAFCMKSHEGLTDQFGMVAQQWSISIGPRTHIILVTTDECLRCLGICDATCVIHYDFPTSPRKFGSRVFCMVKNFRNLTEPGSQDKVDTGRRSARSVLLISEQNARHVVGLLRYLDRTSALVPPELLSFAQGVTLAREDQKTNKPLCTYLKSFGTCRNSSTCPDRHILNVHLDKSEPHLPGFIEVVPLFIKTASVFYGRIVTTEKNFESLAAEMTLFYADKKQGATVVLEGALYAVQEEKDFHRVRVLSVADREDRLFFSVFVHFIDVGKKEEVKAHQLLQLPEQFQSVPGQAVEIIVCGVKPTDSEKDWHPKGNNTRANKHRWCKFTIIRMSQFSIQVSAERDCLPYIVFQALPLVTRAISRKIKGLQHRVQVVLRFGNTLFVDPMVRVTQVPGMKILINEYSVQSEILSSGMAESNPEHIGLLKALCDPESGTKLSKSSNPVMSLENRIQAEEEILVEAFKEAEARKVTTAADRPELELLSASSIVNKPRAPPLVTVPPSSLPLPLIIPRQRLLDQSQENHQKLSVSPQSNKTFEHLASNGDAFSSTSSLVQNGVPEECGMTGGVDVTSNSGQGNGDNNKSLHPAVRWHQTTDALTLTVKLSNPEALSCRFLSDQVMFRGRVDNKWYEANLDLHRNIDADRCSWKLEANETVLTLLKEAPVYWEKLVKAKNIFVSYDFDHLEEDDGQVCNGLSFLENFGEDDLYENSDTDTDVD